VNERERRVGENEALFRSVNEQVRRLNTSLATVDGTMTIVCECGDERCLEQIRLGREEYAVVHGDDTQFIVIPGHVAEDVETVVARNDGYWIVKKDPGAPAELARATAPDAD
jgi:hypothetical protein